MGRERVIPRKLWLLWFQGADKAPLVVKKCIESWIVKNPTWEIVVLDSENLDRYIHLDLPQKKISKIPMTQLSDLVRLALLSNYGGVWADATTLCKMPLDEWIDDCSRSGFFAFYKPGPDRIISSWFIASEIKCPIVVKLYQQLLLYYSKNNFSKPNKFQYKIKKFLSKKFNNSEKTTKYWFNPLITRFLKIYPYFVFHYMFERVISTDSECQAIWRRTRRVSADLPHTAQKLGLFSCPSKSVKDRLNVKEIPVLKLTYKFEPSKYQKNTLLYFLIEGRS